MNKVYKSVWNDTTGTWVATSETARSKTKRGTSRKLIVAQAVLAGVAFVGSGVAHADSDAAALYFDASGTGNSALDSAALAGPNEQAVAAGVGAQAQALQSVAVGSNSNASNTGSTAVGANAFSSGVGSFAGGISARASGDSATAVGSVANVTAVGGTALGAKSSVTGTNSIAVGYAATATNANSVAIGNAAKATSANSVALGANSTTTANLATSAFTPTGPGTTSIAGTTAAGEVSFGSAGNERRLTNVAAGAADTDAVNVSQLKAVDGKVNSLSDAAVQYDTNADGSVNKNSVTLAGTPSTDDGVTGGTTITNLHQGKVSSTSTDAVNGAQLYAVTGDTSDTYITNNGTGVKYVRTNDTGLTPDDAHASGTGSSALGYNAQSTADSSLALGNNAVASANNSVALGAGSTTTADLSAPAQSFGADPATIAGADATGEVSLGSTGNERRLTNVAAGAAPTDAVNVSQLNAVASQAASTAAGAVMYDTNPDGSVNKNSVTLAGTGGTKITNVAPGDVSATSTDAVNGSQLYESQQAATRYFKADGLNNDSDEATVTSGTRGVAVGPNAKASNTNAIAEGNQASASGSNSIALGGTASASGTNGIAIGGAAVSNGTNAVALGANSRALNNNAMALGRGATANGLNSAAVGTGTLAYSDGSTALGTNASVSGSNSVAIGYNALVTGAANSVGLGANTKVTVANSVALGANSTAVTGASAQGEQFGTTGTVEALTGAGEVSLGSAGNERRLTNVAAGAADTDAVNVSQLKAVDGKVNSLSDAAVQYDTNADGSVNKNSVTLAGTPSTDGGVTGGTTITNLHQGKVSSTSTDAVNGAQLYAVTGDTSDTYITNNGTGVKYVRTNDTGLTPDDAHASGTGSSALGYNAQSTADRSLALGNNAVASANNSVALGAGSTTTADLSAPAQSFGSDPATIAGADATGEVSLGSAGNERRLTNVAAGAAPTDAVNVSQLNAVASQAASTAAGAVMYDTNPDGSVNKNSVTLAGTPSTDGGATGGTRVTNLHQGAVSSTSTDAINGAQLYAVTGDTSDTYVSKNGRGVRYVRTNDTGLPIDDAYATGVGSSALGYNAQSIGVQSLALGIWSKASGDGSIAAGNYAQASGIGAIAMGSNSLATAAGGTAIGGYSWATGLYSTAVGEGAKSGGLGSVAVGNKTVAQQDDSVALGNNATASAVNSVALGAGSTTTADLGAPAQSFGADPATIAGTTPAGEVSVGSAGNERRLTNVAAGSAATDAVNVSQLSAVNAKVDNIADGGTLHYFKADGIANGSDDAAASGTQAVAAGANATASGAQSSAFGDGSQATGTSAVAIGSMASAGGNMSVAIGTNAIAIGNNSVALGRGSVATEDNTVSVGSVGNERRITNVAAAVNATDAVNLSELQAATAGSAAESHYFKANGIEDGLDDASADGAQAVAGGVSATASGAQSAAFGYAAQATGASAVAIGSQAAATGNMSAAIGANASATGNNSVALGQGSLADADNTVSVGSVGNERRITNVAPGIAGTDAVNVNQLNAVANQASSTAAGAVTYDTNADGINKSSVTLGGDGGTAIHNVADGVVATDAVNLGQLDAAIGSAINNLAPTAGGNAFFSANGDVDTEAAQSSGTHATAAGANANASGTNAVAIGANSVASGNNTTALGAGANASADNAVALGQGSVADRANTVSVGAAGSERQITNVAAGVQGTDAVNVNQLNSGVSNAVSQANSYTDDQVRSARRDSYGGTASALAAAGLPQAVLPGHGMVAIAGGTYAGQSAVAIGVSQLSETGKWVYKVQGTSDSRGQFGASVGAGMHW